MQIHSCTEVYGQLPFLPPSEMATKVLSSGGFIWNIFASFVTAKDEERSVATTHDSRAEIRHWQRLAAQLSTVLGLQVEHTEKAAGPAENFGTQRELSSHHGCRYYLTRYFATVKYGSAAVPGVRVIRLCLILLYIRQRLVRTLARKAPREGVGSHW